MADSIDVDAQLAAVGALLVEDRALRRLIKHHRNIPGIGLQVPHADSYALPLADLTAAAPELVAGHSGLPARVVAIHGDRAALAAGSPEAWTAAWRAIFHGQVHAAFDARTGESVLTRAALRERIHRIGETEFDEIRVVLRQEEALLPPDTELTTYVEFVALYLELEHFAPHAIARTFPTLHGKTHVDATIALDLDADALLAASRPAAAPTTPLHEPAVTTSTALPAVRSAADSSAAPAAAAARAKGNHARAAILALRAGDEPAARADLDALAAQISAALAGVPTTGWADALLPVARYAANQPIVRFTAGARLLHDLQSACVDAQREDRVVDVITFVQSLGKQPVIRSLPATREIRIAKHLHTANKKIAEAGLTTSAEREQLASAVHDMVEHADHQVRRVLRPKLEAALDAVELRPENLPERVAQKKLVDELLDQAVAVGRLSLGNLRDALSHNNLKMRDLRLAQLARGDQLLRADKLLASSLDGVYRRGEVYLRFLQKLSSILFGTAVGRTVSLYFLLPVLGSFIALEGLQHVVGPLCHMAFDVHPEIATPPAFIGVAIFIFLMVHVTVARAATSRAFHLLGRGLYGVFVAAPRALWRLPVTQRFTGSVVWRFAVKPAGPAAIAALLVEDPYRWPVTAGVFVAALVIINSRPGRLAWELVTDWLVISGRQVGTRLVPGIIRLIIDLFAKLIELFDRGLYRVDEWFRFREGQSRVTIVLKGVFGTLWFFLTYFLRMFVNLMFEPVVNPVKHFPVVTVAAKLTLPFTKAILEVMTPPLASVVGGTLGGALAGFVVFMIPGIAGFLVWELKENWKLYRATQPAALAAIGFGHHGETMTALLRPGFHSGTIPKLYGKLRRAARKNDERGIAKEREALHHVEEAISKFTERELVAMLDEAKHFHATDVCVAHVELASNRVQLELAAPSLGAEAAIIAFEEQGGWLIASVPQRGWITGLPEDQRAILELALSGFYKLAGVDVVREQLEAALRVPAYDVSRDGLVSWPGPGYTTETLYDLHARQLAPVLQGALFGREELRSPAWTSAWESVAADGVATRVLAGPPLV